MDNSNTDERPFRHYTFRHRVEAWISQNLFDQSIYTVRRGLLKGMKRRGGLAWIPDSLVPYTSTPELQFWLNSNLEGMVVYDVGAFHGLLAMYFAQTAKLVVCFEPNSFNSARLEENISLNNLSNIDVHRIGLGSKSETRELVSMRLMPGGASIDSRITNQMLDEETELRQEKIDVFALDDYLNETNISPPDFVKIDVEGLEAEVLKGANQTLGRFHPNLFLEMHGDTVSEKKRKVAEIVEILTSQGYDQILHIESASQITSSNSATAMEGHLFATVKD